MEELIAAAKSSNNLFSRNASDSGGDRYTHQRLAYGEELFTKLRNSKILVVGAGGIGCELLKNLVMTGIGNIYVIDLDTIDVSNLNRQFLFQRQHVGKSKSEVARETVLQFNPDVNITSRLANIFDNEFGIDFYKQFDVVMNALDNLAARNHVNRLCLATGITLIESGTQGYLGQVSVIKKGKTECFECQKKPRQTTYAVCTIRSTPSLPVHCIVWAKMIAATFFGPPDEDSIVKDLKIEVEHEESRSQFAQRLFVHLFDKGIKEQIDMEDIWDGRDPPKQLKLKDFQPESSATIDYEAILKNTMEQLPIDNEVHKFLYCTEQLLQRDDVIARSFSFDKDDKLAIGFVSSAANLRSQCYGIERITTFSAKGIAGNIVHAIATANAICAALQTSEAIKILGNRFDDCRAVWITKSLPKVINRNCLQPPNPECWVCSAQKLQLCIDINTFSAANLLDQVCKNTLGMKQPCITTDTSVIERDLEYFEDEKDPIAAMKVQLAQPVSRPCHGVTDNQTLHVTDDLQDYKIDVLIKHSTDLVFEEDEPRFKLLSHTGEDVPSEAPPTPHKEGGDVEMKDAAKAIDISSSAEDVVMTDGKSEKRESPTAVGEVEESHQKKKQKTAT